MNWSEDIKKQCGHELKRICSAGILNIDIPELIYGESHENNFKGNYYHKDYKIVIYINENKSIDDVLCSVRHEARHAWQYKHYENHCKWWERNDAFYQLLSTPYLSVLLGKYCSMEADAVAFAEKRPNNCEVKLSDSEEMLNEMMWKVVNGIKESGILSDMKEKVSFDEYDHSRELLASIRLEINR